MQCLCLWSWCVPSTAHAQNTPLPNAGDRVNNRCTHLVKGSKRWEFEKDMIM